MRDIFFSLNNAANEVTKIEICGSGIVPAVHGGINGKSQTDNLRPVMLIHAIKLTAVDNRSKVILGISIYFAAPTLLILALSCDVMAVRIA